MKKGILAILTAFVFCFSLGSVQTAHASWLGDLLGAVAKSSSSTAEKYIISGKIVNTDGLPIEGITVTATGKYNKTERTTTTDANGNYQLTYPGFYDEKKSTYEGGDVYITAKGNRWRTCKKELNLSVWLYNTFNYVENITLRHDTVTGKVTDPDGLPMHWVKLTFEMDGGQKGVQTVYTDENGNYTYELPESSVSYWYTIHQDGYKDLRGQKSLYDEQVWNITMQLL